MTSSYLIMGARSSEMAAGDVSGGANTSQTMVVGVLTALVDASPVGARSAARKQAVLEAKAREPRAYAWAVAESHAARPDEHATPPEPPHPEAAAGPRLGRPGTTPGR
jgi:hypothetical protein